MDELGARVRGFRQARGLTGSALARQAGIDAGQLSRIEHGQAKRPGVSFVQLGTESCISWGWPNCCGSARRSLCREKGG